jgi:hypothetical protein
MGWLDGDSWTWGDLGKAGLGLATGGASLLATGIGPQGGALDLVGSDPGADVEKLRKQQLAQQAAAAGGFADQAQGNYANMTAQGNAQLGALRDLQSGRNSVSAEQLRQGLQQQQAAQMSMAAGASPNNAAMAARNAAMNMGRAGYGMAGQQAIAGLQERNQATQNLSGLIQGMRGQDVNASLGSRGNAITGYGAGNAGAPEKSWIDKYGPAIQAGAQAYAASDKRLKTDVTDGDADANKAIAGLRAYGFMYKDAKHGRGKQTGIMAQDMERVGLGHAVVDTPEGKMVHGAKAATAGLAMVAALGRRVSKLEGGK